MNVSRVPSLLRASIFAACAVLSSIGNLLAIPAFPGAEGFGANATGGRGGNVYHVTNLNDSGTGSFRDAVGTANRTVVFDVGGIIRITSPVVVKANITIAGQTAPGDGVALYGNRISFSDASNTICRYMRFREGINGDSGTDAVGIASGHDMIFDHVSASWGRDETFSVSGSPISNITIQDCIIGQGLLIHSAGGLIQTSGGVSIFRTLYADNWMRNPKVKGVNDYINNVVYNWGSGGGYIPAGDSAGDTFANMIGCYFIGGPNSGVGTSPFKTGNQNYRLYHADNLQDLDLDGALNGVPVTAASFPTLQLVPTPFVYPAPVTTLAPTQALQHVLTYAGASRRRDSVDAYIVNEVLSYGSAGAQIANESEVGGVGTLASGLPVVDTDGDGMPDWWEEAAGTNPLAADNNVVNADGYTNLEHYINAIAVVGVPAATITGIMGDTGTASNDGVTSDNSLILNGTAAPGATVALSRVDIGLIGTMVADASGKWSFDYTGTPLADRYYAFTATVDLGGGKVSPSTPAFVVKVDTVTAAAPVITSVVTSPVMAFSGTAEPSSVITVWLGGVVVGTTTTDALGNWNAIYTGSALVPGAYAFSASAVDLAGNKGSASSVYVVDTTVASPVFTSITDDTGNLSTDFITKDTTLYLNGAAPAGSTVTVTRVGVGVIGSTTASTTGAWSFSYIGTTLVSGQYTFTATAALSGSSSPASAPCVVTVDTVAPTTSSITRLDPVTASTQSTTLVYRVTFAEPVINVDTGDFTLTSSGTGMTGVIASLSAVSSSVYDVTITGAGGDGALRLDRKANASISDIAGNTISTGTYTGGLSYAMRLPGSGVWQNDESGGRWSDVTNWDLSSGGIANGVGATADFGALDITSDVTVTLDTPRSLGRIVTGDADYSTPASWTISNNGTPANTITLSTNGTPTIQVDGATTTSGDTVDVPAANAYPTNLDASLVSVVGFTKTGVGTLQLTQPNPQMTGPLTITKGIVQVGPGGTLAPSSVSIATSQQLRIAGGIFSTIGDVTWTSGSGTGIVVSSGSASFKKIIPSNVRNSFVKVTGGTMMADDISFLRSGDSETQTVNTGVLISGGESTVGTIGLGTGNSWAGMTVSGGKLTVPGVVYNGYQVTAARGGVIYVSGGELNIKDTAYGLVMSRNPGTQANNVSKLTITGGVTNLARLTLGYDATVTAGSATVSVTSGELNLGSGGIVKNGTSGLASSITLNSGTLGALVSWSTTHPVILVGSRDDTNLRGADSLGNPFNFSLDGIVSGTGGFTKTGDGVVTLSAVNTFTGDVAVDRGALNVTGSFAPGGTLTVNAGGTLTGTGLVGKSIALNDRGFIASGIGDVGTLSGESLIWNGGGHLVFDLTGGNTLALSGTLIKGMHGALSVDLSSTAQPLADTVYPLASFGATDLTLADLSLAPTHGFLGVLQLDATSLKFLVTGVGATAEYTNWAYLQNIPIGQRGALDDPDNDGLPNLLEFYLAHNPLVAASGGIMATTVEIGGEKYPSIAYVRRKNVGGITGEVQVASGLNLATLFSVVELSTTDNGDGTENVIVRSALPLSQQPQQFFRIAVILPGSGQIPVKSSPVGVLSETYHCGRSGLAFPLIDEDLFIGVVSSNDFASLVFPVESGNLGNLLAPGRRYFVEVLTGAFEGERFDIDTDVTTAEGNSSLLLDFGADTFSTLSALLPDELAGARCVIRPHVTLGDVSSMYTPGLNGNRHRERADSLLILDSRELDEYYLGEDGESWYSKSDHGPGDWGLKQCRWSQRHGHGLVREPVDYRNMVIPPDVSVVVELNSGPRFWVHSGIVRTNAFRKNLECGMQAFASGFPVDFSPAGIGALVDPLTPKANRWFGSNIWTFADQIEVLYSGRKSLSLYYLKGDGHTWQTPTQRSHQDFSTEPILGDTDMIIIRRKNSDSGFVIPRPFGL